MYLRIKEYPDGWLVEIEKKTWYGRRYWTYLISARGLDSYPCFFKTYDAAMDNLLKKIRFETTILPL